jgi:hypothetical protein
LSGAALRWSDISIEFDAHHLKQILVDGIKTTTLQAIVPHILNIQNQDLFSQKYHVCLHYKGMKLA